MARKTDPNVNKTDEVRDLDSNPDPITGAPGSHPVGTGVGSAGGAAAGAVAGAAIGTVGGPVGQAVGAMIGGVAGAIGGAAAGHAVAENIDPTVERTYWSENYRSRPYYETGLTYEDDYDPAYTYGWEARARYRDRNFDDVEPELRSDWERTKARSRLSWEQAKAAVRDAWDRVSTRTDRAAYPDRRNPD